MSYNPRYQPVSGHNETELQNIDRNPRVDDGDDLNRKSVAYTYVVPEPDYEFNPVATAATSTLSGPQPVLQTRYSTIAEPGRKGLGHNYRPLKQMRKLAQRLLARWMVNLTFCSLMVVLLKYYENDGILTQYEKRIFNGLFLGLSLFISMNMVNSLKSMADMMKWSILARGRWSAREMDLILTISSYQKAVKLLGLWKGKPWRLLALTNWICLGLGAQVTVAILGLTFNHESEDAEFAMPGEVNVTMLDHYYPDSAKGAPPKTFQEDYIAHLYGDMIFAQITSAGDVGKVKALNTIGTIDDASIEPTDKDSLEKGGYTGWKYYYNDWTRFPGQYTPNGYKTDRYVTIDASCERHAIVEGQDGTSGTFVIEYVNKTREPVEWLAGFIGEEGTTYVAKGSNTTCGTRCAKIGVYQMVPSGSTEEGDYFLCTVDVSKVENVKTGVHELGDVMAARAAAAIGLSGFTVTPVGNGTVGPFQSFLYNNATEWGQRMHGNKDLMASVLGLFTTGSIANMDRYNPRVTTKGMRLHGGVRLLVVWHYVYLCLCIIIGGHSILAVLVGVRANSVFCKQDSPLSTARLLRPIVERLGPSGCAASGEEIAASFSKKMSYGVRSSPGGHVHHLDIGEDLEMMSVFPEGYYD